MLSAHNLQYHYPHHTHILFQEVNLDIYQGEKIGLVGQNGSGKTTLLQILLGLLPVAEGEIQTAVSQLNFAYLPQNFSSSSSLTLKDWMEDQFPEISHWKKVLLDLEKRLGQTEESLDAYTRACSEFESRGGYELEVKIEGILFEMGFSQSDFHRPFCTLSSGEKQRAALGAIFIQDADLIVLDEPTNHLDGEGIEILENYLFSSDHTYLMVSHDRKLLDRCAEKIFELDRGTLTEYGGNYTYYVREKEKARQRALHEYEVQKKKLENLKAELQRKKEWGHAKESQKYGQGHVDRGYIGRRAAKLMKRARHAEKRREQLLEKHEVERPEKKADFEAGFPQVQNPGNYIFSAEKVTKAYGEETLFEEFSLTVYPGDRLALLGPNGAGKTTLFRMITGAETPDEGSVYLSEAVCMGFCSQSRNLYPQKESILEVLKRETGQKETRIRHTLARLGLIGKIAHRLLEDLSPGEKTLVELAALMLRATNLLILDEPTNHLDLPRREALEEALLEYGGTIVFSSHDRYFVDKIATRKIDLQK